MTNPPSNTAERGERRWPRLRTFGVAAALVLGACGGAGGADTVAATGPVAEAAAAAEANMATINSSGETVFDIEVLSVADGGITTLNDVIDGDKPVLLWFWSPH